MDDESNSAEGVVYHAGFPNASEDAEAMALSLDSLVVRHKASTYFWRLDSGGVPELGWKGGDIVVVDRALTPKHHSWLAVVVEQEFVLRQFIKSTNEAVFLKPNGEREEQEVTIWGVVTYVVHQVGRPL